ncbi:toprim domain-containing protein [Thalassotalea nanhaiensis]|uniref:Toprim domain-containing protein n=1 Tax=Thalassotalea nanhaiensis TaxID=3065648 RepID=A0ABY9TML6_9GAMM|nr:toprim domain-containing protein [Colwelliaceae bacterium SQ345]
MKNYNEMLAATRCLGLKVNYLNLDGNLHRVPTDAKPKSFNGFYRYFPDNQTLYYGDWQLDITRTWRSEHSEQTQSDRFAIKQLMDRQKKQQEQDLVLAIQNARDFYNSSQSATTQQYLTDKHIIAPEGVRVHSGNLIIPLVDLLTAGIPIMNVQTIWPNGKKLFMKNARISGFCFPIGLIEDELESLYIAEGFSTAMTVHMITDELVLAAMNAGNLESVALAARKRWPKAKIIITGDDDWLTEQKTGINPGIKKATEAANAIGGFTCFPPFTAEQRKNNLTDWNDYLFSASGRKA